MVEATKTTQKNKAKKSSKSKQDQFFAAAA